MTLIYLWLGKRKFIFKGKEDFYYEGKKPHHIFYHLKKRPKMKFILFLSMMFIFMRGGVIDSYGDSLSVNILGKENLRSQLPISPLLSFSPGEALHISTWPDTGAFPEGVYLIDGEGYVNFPIIGFVKVTEFTPDSLAKFLAEKYVDFMRYPHMTIRPLIRIAFNGGFYKPGLYWVDPRYSLWEALQLAGGVTRTDGFKKLKWERGGTVLTKDLTPLLEEGKSLYQIGFKSGDQITIVQTPHREGWELFKADVLPIITLSVSTIISVLSIYNTLMIYRRYYK